MSEEILFSYVRQMEYCGRARPRQEVSEEILFSYIRQIEYCGGARPR